ncbi:MAG TPA: ABC transporter substrate-binding protein [Methylomirabilota bacterium]|nr:ABC transporter substrate-binding protein [Methylomirabilota bacterium]
MARRAFFAVTTLGWLLVTGAEAASPTETLRATFGQANQIISDPTTQDRPLERLVAIRALFGKVFDFRGAAERALGPEWRVRTPVEQREFTSIFSGFVQRGFVYWLASVAEVDESAGGITVLYLGESVNRDRAAVRTALVGRGGRQIRLDHEMVYQGNRWMVRDIKIDGISLLTNYRAQFDRVMRASSYRELVTRMQERVGTDLPRPAAARPEPIGADLRVPLHLYETR